MDDRLLVCLIPAIVSSVFIALLPLFCVSTKLFGFLVFDSKCFSMWKFLTKHRHKERFMRMVEYFLKILLLKGEFAITFG